MNFFKRKRKSIINGNVKTSDIFVITSMIISSHNDGTGCGPMCVTMYFLAKCEAGEYYELFSGKKLEKEKQSDGDFLSLKFDTPYVKKAEPLNIYLKNTNKSRIDIQSLFDFITYMNVMEKLDTFLDKEDE